MGKSYIAVYVMNMRYAKGFPFYPQCLGYIWKGRKHAYICSASEQLIKKWNFSASVRFIKFGKISLISSNRMHLSPSYFGHDNMTCSSSSTCPKLQCLQSLSLAGWLCYLVSLLQFQDKVHLFLTVIFFFYDWNI